ncbi:hypothetical protein [Lachnoclostridium phytofermentans]|uniref:hypothetical protein n=1 Tax=Lachnoclostridium phytofermentans TaxID=66219 RepID=UPI000301209B|nr:hypothetical protein [Lachnoclostridium phytofermentans]
MVPFTQENKLDNGNRMDYDYLRKIIRYFAVTAAITFHKSIRGLYGEIKINHL